MRPLVLALAVLLSGSISHAADVFSGDAPSFTADGRKTDPFYLKVSRNGKLSGTIFSNTFSRRIPVKGTVRRTGRFEIRVSQAGLSGSVSGKIKGSRLDGSARLRGTGVGEARLRIEASTLRRSPNGAPDITGECEFPGSTPGSRPEFQSCRLKFSRSGDGRNYDYTALFQHYWYRDQTFTVPGSFPVPASMNFSFGRAFGPQQHSFNATFSPVSPTQVQITVDSVGPSQSGVWKTRYQGYYTVRP